MIQENSVTFQPGDKKVYVLAGTRLQEAATAADLVLDAPCGGEGTCGKCRVVVSEGAAPPTAEERNLLTDEELHAGCRLACQTIVGGPMSVLVPGTSLVNRPYQILVHSEAAVEADGAPVICKRYVELPLPDRGDDVADLARLERRLGPVQADLSLVRELPRRLRDANFQGTAVLDDDRLIDFEPGNTQWDSFGVAVDLGTTTLVAALLDLATGRQVRIASRLNPQTRFGDDVLTRILMARTSSDGLEQLQQVVAEAIDEMIGELCDATGIARQQVYHVTLAGNTTMQQLFCGIDPGPVGRSALRARGPTGAGFSGRGRRLADPSPRPGLRPADHRRLRGRRHRGRHPGNRAGRLHGPDPLDRYRHQRRDRALGGGQTHGDFDRGRAGLRRGADRPGDAGQPGGHREGRGRSEVAGPRDRPRSAAGAVRFGLDRRHGGTLAAWHRFAPRPSLDTR